MTAAYQNLLLGLAGGALIATPVMAEPVKIGAWLPITGGLAIDAGVERVFRTRSRRGRGDPVRHLSRDGPGDPRDRLDRQPRLARLAGGGTAEQPVRTILGDSHWDERGLPEGRPFPITQWQSGKLEFVYPVGEFPGTPPLLWPKPSW